MDLKHTTSDESISISSRRVEHQESKSNLCHAQDPATTRPLSRHDWRSPSALLSTNIANIQSIQKFQ